LSSPPRSALRARGKTARISSPDIAARAFAICSSRRGNPPCYRWIILSAVADLTRNFPYLNGARVGRAQYLMLTPNAAGEFFEPKNEERPAKCAKPETSTVSGFADQPGEKKEELRFFASISTWRNSSKFF
jgi:hypothetical protein